MPGQIQWVRHNIWQADLTKKHQHHLTLHPMCIEMVPLEHADKLGVMILACIDGSIQYRHLCFFQQNNKNTSSPPKKKFHHFFSSYREFHGNFHGNYRLPMVTSHFGSTFPYLSNPPNLAPPSWRLHAAPAAAARLRVRTRRSDQRPRRTRAPWVRGFRRGWLLDVGMGEISQIKGPIKGFFRDWDGLSWFF